MEKSLKGILFDVVIKLFRKVLIATDGSEYTKKAVDYRIELAINTGAKLQAIYVVDTGGYKSIPLSAPMKYAFSLLRLEGDKAIRYVAEKAEAGGRIKKLNYNG